jgi:hypothetical protein
LKNIGGEITDGILLKGEAQKIKVIYWWRDYLCPLVFGVVEVVILAI